MIILIFIIALNYNHVYLKHIHFIRYVNLQDENETNINNAFNVPEVESPMVKQIIPKVSTAKGSSNQGKKTVQIHSVTSKMNKTKIIGMLLIL